MLFFIKVCKYFTCDILATCDKGFVREIANMHSYVFKLILLLANKYKTIGKKSI